MEGYQLSDISDQEAAPPDFPSWSLIAGRWSPAIAKGLTQLQGGFRVK
jgi:hypothetical protein